MVRKAKGPVKRNNKTDVKAAGVILALFVVGVLLFMFFNKSTEAPKSKSRMPAKPAAKLAVKPKPYKQTSSFPAAVITTPKIVSKKKIAPGSAGRIAFVLDDWGGSLKNCKYLKEIPDPLAIAILPSLRYTDEIAKCASINGKTVMLHLPMEAQHNKDLYPVDYLIKTSMKPAKVEKILNGYLQKMPWIEGVNNHMGSKVTEDRVLMQVILKRLKKKNLFFLDSMTAQHSVCNEIAGGLGLPFTQRDIFLDNINTREEIIKQIVALAARARKNGSAIAIGHDRSLTLQVLKEQIPILKEQGFDIVNVKTLLRKK